MRKYFIIFFIFTFCKSGVARQNHADSLIAKLNILPDNEARFPLLQQLSDKPNDFGVKIKYANEGIALSKKLNLPKEEEKFIAFIATAEADIDDYPAVLATSFRGLQLSEQLDDNYYKSRFLYSIGKAYGFQNVNDRSISYFRQGIQVASAAKDTLEMVRLCSYLESIYADLKKTDSASFFVHVEYQLITHSKNKIILAETGTVLGDFGEAQSSMNHPDSALQYYYRSLPYFRRDNDIWLIIFTENLIAKAYLEIAQPDSAYKYALDAFRLSKIVKKYDSFAEAATILSQLYEGKNDAKSLFYYKAAVAGRDSATGADKTRRFQAVIYSEQQRQADLNYAAIDYKNKLRFFAAIGGLVLVAVIGLILWIVNKKQRKGNILLAQQKQQVENTLLELKQTQTQLIQSEKMASLGELTAGIAHEIQNPLNFVNNFSEVNKELMAELEEELKNGNMEDALAIAADIKQNEEKINHHGKRADFIVKGMLQHSRTSSGEKELTNINVMADEFFKLSYHGLRAKDKNFNAEMVTDFDKDLPLVNIAQQDIGRVLLNLFNNAFYAVNQKQKIADADYKPEVWVSTSIEKNKLIIKVKDNGNGIPDAIKDKIMQPFFTTKPTGEGTGLGLSLSYDIIVKGHGGKIEVNNNAEGGADFIISIPV